MPSNDQSILLSENDLMQIEVRLAAGKSEFIIHAADDMQRLIATVRHLLAHSAQARPSPLDPLPNSAQNL